MSKLYKSECYCTNLRRSANSITEYYNRYFNDLNLTVAQYYIIVNLSRLKNANSSDLSKRIGLERSTLVRNIQGLIKKGLIEEGGEGKGHQFKLTKKGEKVLKNAKTKWKNAQDKMKKFLGEEDSAALLRIADKLQYLDETLF